ncbi:MAG: SpoIID/LytB domain-containing protein [Lachnospiraceae bacterium]|nr:SpoIID/LytB domain-containing protein [Lachnospiraceae bacterium]
MNSFLLKPLIWFRRLFLTFLLIFTVSMVPCMVYWFRTGSSRGLAEDALTDMAGVRIQVNNCTVNVENFLIFMISVDYQPDMEEEALKAFAVAARSSLYAHLNRYLQETAAESDGEEQNYKTIHADKLGVMYDEPAEMVCVFSEAAGLEGKEHWADIYDYVKKAVEMTGGQYLVCTDKGRETEAAEAESVPVDVLWHGCSAGNTRFYEGNLTGQEDGISLYSPQLKSMDGKDGEFSRAVTITVYSRRELAQLLWEIPGTEDILEKEKILSSYITIENRDSSGYITEMSLGNREMTGEEAAQLLQVSSGCFYVSDLSDDSLKIVTFGIGRGYGMSLAGASAMALQGADYREILEYYFPVCGVNNFTSLGTE